MALLPGVPHRSGLDIITCSLIAKSALIHGQHCSLFGKKAIHVRMRQRTGVSRLGR